jgi:hypothetical protein
MGYRKVSGCGILRRVIFGMCRVTGQTIIAWKSDVKGGDRSRHGGGFGDHIDLMDPNGVH